MGKILEESKAKFDNQKKEEKDMKTKKILNTIKDVAFIALVAMLIGIYVGIQYQKGQAALIKTEAASIVKDVKVDISK